MMCVASEPTSVWLSTVWICQGICSVEFPDTRRWDGLGAEPPLVSLLRKAESPCATSFHSHSWSVGTYCRLHFTVGGKIKQEQRKKKRGEVKEFAKIPLEKSRQSLVCLLLFLPPCQTLRINWKRLMLGSVLWWKQLQQSGKIAVTL